MTKRIYICVKQSIEKITVWVTEWLVLKKLGLLYKVNSRRGEQVRKKNFSFNFDVLQLCAVRQLTIVSPCWILM